MLKTAALVAVAITGTVVASSVAADTATEGPEKVHSTATYKLVATDPFYVDTGDPGDSSGDMFGAGGRIESGGEKVGTFASNCVAVLPNGRCGATFLLEDRGRVELSGLFRFGEQSAQSKLAVVGGTREFRHAHGSAEITPEGMGEVQRVELKIVE